MVERVEDLNLTWREKWRVARRLAGLYVWTMTLLWARIAFRPTRSFAPRFERWMRRQIMKTWATGALWIAGIHVDTNGYPPDRHFYIVANHLSYLDIIIFARYLGCVFVAMKEMDDWPVVGFIVRNMDTIFVDRSSLRDAVRANHRIEQAMSSQHSVMLFPESTTTAGEEMLPFRPALLQTAAAKRFPVHSAGIRYETTAHCNDPATQVCWTDDTPFSVHAVRLLSLRRVDAAIRFSPQPVTSDCRKNLAQDLEAQVRELVYGPPESIEDPASV